MKRLYLLVISVFLLSCSSNQHNKKEKDTNPFYDQAYAYRDAYQTDSAFIFFAKAKELFLKRKDSIGVANCLVNSAIISTNIGDYFGGQELSLNALSYLNKEKKEDRIYLHSNYNNLAIASERLRDYVKAIGFYDLAIKFASDSPTVFLYLSNKANAFQELKQYKNALTIYNKLLQKDNGDKATYARILSNVAVTRWQSNQNYNPLPELRKALYIRQQENDLWGLNSSYGYISNYYIKYNIDSTLHYSKKMLTNAQQLNSADDQLFALQKLIKFSPKPDRDTYFERYLTLDDSLQTARNLAKNRFALIKFETEKHKTDNLVLQKQNSEKTYQIIIITTVSLLVLILGAFWYRKRQQHLKLTAEKTIKENQLRTSKKVHDRVANKIYRVISEIENKEDLNKDHLLDQLDDIYNTSRDISYEITDSQHEKTFSEQLGAMFFAYATSDLTIDTINNSNEVWINVSDNKRSEIYVVLMELMTNMKKHSRATTVKIEFQQREKGIVINYHDNGVGFLQGISPGNGLRNTETRIKNISGNITFESNDKTGLKIKMSFPVD